MRWAAIDFEFNQTKHPKLNLVCASIRTETEVFEYWLHKSPSTKNGLAKKVEELHQAGYTFLAYAVTAEARSFLALNLDPMKYTWIDLYLEYRCLLNHNHNLMYGKQLKDGKKTVTKPPKPKYERTEKEDQDADYSKPEAGLAAACYKLLDVDIDTVWKKAMRDLIISTPAAFFSSDRDSIQAYCTYDTQYLYPLYLAMVKEYERLLRTHYRKEVLLNEMHYRAKYACLTAIREELGYPINVNRTKNFSQQVPNILLACQREINSLFPDRPPFYKLKKAEGTYTLHQAAIREEIKLWKEKHPKIKWMLTEGGTSGEKDLSLSLKAFQQHFNYTHTYPKDNYFAQLVRFLKLKQNLNGFMPGGKTNFWDYVGPDGFVRPYMGIYSAQSSRSQPKASGFIPLKSAWMRCLIEPKPGYAMASIDFKSQEFLIAALLSKDAQMLKDYQTGDVYLAFGKSTGYIPKDGTREKYDKERNNCKPIILGIQFDMSKYGLSADLTEKWGREVTIEEAEGWIKKHKDAYPRLWRWKENIQKTYTTNKFIKLPDGWCMWGDNPNFRSVGNIPVQGLGGCIMRKADFLAHENGLKLPYTLHDALYLYDTVENIQKSLLALAQIMDKAFRYPFPEDMKRLATVGLEADIWSMDFPKEVKKFNLTYKNAWGEPLEMEVKQQQEYIDPRGKEEYEYFKQYLEDPTKLDYTTLEF